MLKRSKVICAICGGKLEEEEARCGDRGALYEGKPLCEVCWEEDEASATVFYGEDDTPNVIGEARNHTEGHFSVSWVPIDVWRGYYEVRSPEYTLVNEAELLAWHESQQMLKNFDQTVRGLFQKHNIDYARVFARSSNVFCQHFSLFAKKCQALEATVLVGLAKKKVDYDNPSWGRGILFSESTLDKLAELFPEEHVTRDSDVFSLAERYNENLVREVEARLQSKRATDSDRQ